MDGLEVGLLETLLKKHTRERGVARVLDVDFKSALGPGENYASEILRVTANVVLGSGRITKRTIIVKRMREEDPTRTLHSFFSFETLMYTEILPKMGALMEEHGDTNDVLWSNYYGTTGNMILFEDLKSQGFKMADRQTGQDLNHALFTLRSLARFHAMSSVLLNRGSITKTQFPVTFFAKNDRTVNMLCNGGFKALADTIESTWGPEWRKTAEKLRDVGATMGAKLQELYSYDEDKFHVINHGDCWVNNMMFKYESHSDHPIGLRFVDFQMSHCNSYGWDLLYFFYSSIKPEVRRGHMEELLSAYQKTLVSTLEFFGSVPENAPTLSDVESEMERLLIIGLMVSCTLLPITMADPADAMDPTPDLEAPDAILHNRNMFKNKKYNEVLQQDIKHYIEKGLL